MPMSLHTVTWPRIDVADALFTENNVFMPSALSRSTSKYGNRRVEPGRLEEGGGVCAVAKDANPQRRITLRTTILVRMVTCAGGHLFSSDSSNGGEYGPQNCPRQLERLQ